MRTLFIFSAAVLSGACSDTCGLGTQLNGRVYDAFVHPVVFETVENAASFPAEGSPANGPIAIGFEWGAATEGPITVFMDGQAFDGTGTFYDQDCGNFQAAWSGEYEASDGSVHTFATAGLFQFYDQDDQAILAGQLDYTENWSAGGQKGTFTVSVAELRGSIGVSGTATAR